ncbi:MAG: Uma2 family endonuclease [Desulfobacterales bacterium]|nr:Uma2 family endonuclease [Desulfobacterales bacterium]
MSIAGAKKSETADKHHVLRVVPNKPSPLKTGDWLTADEFERRYNAMPDVKNAELIEGVVYMGSPVGADHSSSHGEIMGWLGMYCFATPGLKIHDNGTLRIDAENEYQPDAILRIEFSGGSVVSKDGYLEGAPELVAEIAVTSASHDLKEKKKVYQRIGVQEYIVWQVRKNSLDWFYLESGEYMLLKPDADGVIHSRVFPGLCLPPDALLKRNLAGVAAELQKGLHGKEHAEFVRQLKLSGKTFHA